MLLYSQDYCAIRSNGAMLYLYIEDYQYYIAKELYDKIKFTDQANKSVKATNL